MSILKTLFYIRDIGDVHRSKPPPTVHYQKAMPDIDDLMQVDSCHWQIIHFVRYCFFLKSVKKKGVA